MSNARNIASGVKFVDTAGDTMTGDLVVNAEVGIGRSPTSTYKLDVHGEVNNNWLAHIHNTHTTSGYGVKIRAGDDNSVSAFRVSSQDNATTILDATGGGVVTTPNQPLFIAYTDSSFAGVANSNTIARNINGTYANVGGHYTTSGATASRFTAPVAGKYHFGFQFLLQNVATSDDSIHISFHKNGSLDHYANSRYDGQAANGNFGFGGYLPIIGTSVQNLSANDYIEINVYSSGSINLYQSANWSRYYGYLIG